MNSEILLKNYTLPVELNVCVFCEFISAYKWESTERERESQSVINQTAEFNSDFTDLIQTPDG